MPKLETALYDYLSQDPGVAGLVGDRIYPTKAKEGSQLPAITWQRTNATRTYTYDSYADTSAWTQARIRFHCWSNTAQQAIEVGEAVLLALSGYGGQMSGEYIGGAEAVLELDDYDGQVKLYRRVLDFFITYEDPGNTS